MRTIFTLLLTGCAFAIQAQTPAGNAFRIDYDEFQNGGGIKYLDCGNDDALNPGEEMTMMVWAQFRDFNDNQKICGKFNLDNTGFVMGVNQGRIYCEAWNPTFYEGLDGLMNPTSEFWYHLTMTYSAGDAMRTYINGEEVGVHDVSNNALAESDNPFIIGVSPWEDFNSFQSFGNLDEMAYFNYALSEDDIKAQMFKGISGSEEELIAAWNFDDATGTTAPDVGNGIANAEGVGNFTGSEWVESTAVIADANTETASDLAAIWNGVTFTDPRFTTSDQGMNLLGTELTNEDYVVFGHNDEAGTTDADIPTNASPSFMRASRVWSVTDQSVTAMNVLFNLTQVSAGGTTLDDTYPAANYTLLYRPAGGTTFSSAANASTFSSGVAVFEGVSLQSGEYTIGVGDGIVDSVDDIAIAKAEIQVFPNPTEGQFVLAWQNAQSDVEYIISDVTGRAVQHMQVANSSSAKRVIDLGNEQDGMYVISILINGVWHNQRLIKQ